MKIIPNYSLLHHNTFGIDARAACFVEYETPEELVNFLVNGISESRLPLLCIGGGSNLLFTSDYRGTVLHSAIKGYEVVNETSEYVDVCVGSGEKWDDVVAYAVSNKWYGVENLSFIPPSAQSTRSARSTAPRWSWRRSGTSWTTWSCPSCSPTSRNQPNRRKSRPPGTPGGLL